jgi:hypothetical protein
LLLSLFTFECQPNDIVSFYLFFYYRIRREEKVEELEALKVKFEVRLNSQTPSLTVENVGNDAKIIKLTINGIEVNSHNNRMITLTKMT